MALISVIFLGVYFASICAVGYAVFSPFRGIISRPPTGDTRFTVVDLLAVFLPFAIGYAALNGIYPDIDWNTRVSTFFGVTALVITSVAWFYGMRLLWRMRVDNSIKRFLLLGILMPAGFVVPVVALPVTIYVESGAQFGYRFSILACIVIVMRMLSIWIRSGEDASTAQTQNA